MPLTSEAQTTKSPKFFSKGHQIPPLHHLRRETCRRLSLSCKSPTGGRASCAPSSPAAHREFQRLYDDTSHSTASSKPLLEVQYHRATSTGVPAELYYSGTVFRPNTPRTRRTQGLNPAAWPLKSRSLPKNYTRSSAGDFFPLSESDHLNLRPDLPHFSSLNPPFTSLNSIPPRNIFNSTPTTKNQCH